MRRTACARVFVLAGVAAFAAAGCYEGSLGEVLSELSGEYKIPDYDCWIRVSGSHVTAVGADGEAPCVDESSFESEDYSSTYTETLTVDGTISEGHVVGTMTYTEDESDTWGGCEESFSYAAELHLDVSKSEGAQSSGKFSALAGTWAGSLDLVEDWSEGLTAGSGCEDDPYADSDEQTTYFEIGADVEGDQAYVRYREGGDDWEAFYVDAPSDDELTIDGEEIEIR